MSDDAEQIERLATATEKLLREVERLRRDVRSVGERVVPAGEWYSSPADRSHTERRPRDVPTAIRMIDALRLEIQGAERDVATIKGIVVAAQNSAHPRSDMEPYLTNRPPAKKRR